MITARKAGKLPGKLLDGHYSYEYGKNSLAIQSRSIEKFNNFGKNFTIFVKERKKYRLKYSCNKK